jgi:hypothetical protein
MTASQTCYRIDVVEIQIQCETKKTEKVTLVGYLTKGNNEILARTFENKQIKHGNPFFTVNLLLLLD